MDLKGSESPYLGTHLHPEFCFHPNCCLSLRFVAITNSVRLHWTQIRFIPTNKTGPLNSTRDLKMSGSDDLSRLHTHDRKSRLLP